MSHQPVGVACHEAITTITMRRPERRNALSLDHLASCSRRSGRWATPTPGRWSSPPRARCSAPATTSPTWPAPTSCGAATAAGLHRADDHHPGHPPARGGAGARASPRRPGASWCAPATWPWPRAPAGFAVPGGKGGWFCHTPLVATSRVIGRKRALEMAFTGDAVDAATALDWGLVNRVVPADELGEARRPGPARQPGQRGVEGPRQGRVLRPGRPRPAQGLRLHGRAHGRHQPAPRRPGRHRRVPGEAPARLVGERPRATTTWVGVTRTRYSPGTPLRAPNSSARSAPM